MVATLILFFHFWKWIIVGALLTTGAFLMFQRLRELTG
jgi:ABC-type multidrug transport system permease subunit